MVGWLWAKISNYHAEATNPPTITLLGTSPRIPSWILDMNAGELTIEAFSSQQSPNGDAVIEYVRESLSAGRTTSGAVENF